MKAIVPSSKRFLKSISQMPLVAQIFVWSIAFFALAIPVAIRWQPLETVDIASLRLINEGLATQWLDNVMIFFSRLGNLPLTWVLIVFWLGYWSLKRMGDWRKALLKWLFSVLAIAVALGCADGISGKIAKPIVGRERPSKIVKEVRLVGGSGKAKGFPSSHASNAFAVARVLHELAPPKMLWWLLALTIAISRVYLGYHFPTDVIGGAMLGLAIGSIVALIINWSKSHFEVSTSR
ncbi:MAG: phosphatase PAP2 family protein [Armatimonadetes bacterium]|nr:phosphatase PAP2 family protein [Armatimonadota bacterium]MDW8029387.1 phosphatase PAP2 family protein [Armatimonadota bacterium]